MKIVHIEDRFHPEMGYQLNFFAKYHNRQHQFYIVTSDTLSLWDKSIDISTIIEMDKVFEANYDVKIIRLKTKFDRKDKIGYDVPQEKWLSSIFFDSLFMESLSKLKHDKIIKQSINKVNFSNKWKVLILRKYMN